MGRYYLAGAYAKTLKHTTTPLYLSGRAGDKRVNIYDTNPFLGPARAVLDAVHQLPPSLEKLLVVPIDMPFLTLPLLQSLLAEEESAYYASYPLPASLVLAKLLKQAKEYRIY